MTIYRRAVLAMLIAGTTWQATANDTEITNQTPDKRAAEEVAKELANPNTALASLNLKFQYYGGNSDTGDNFNTTFQPVLPFPLDNGDKVIFRPAVSYIANNNDFSDESGFSDIAFDLAYAPKLDGGYIGAVGLFASVPTGSDGFSAEQFAVGPEFMFGKVSQERVVGIFPNHLYGVAGDGADNAESRTNKTSAQLFWVELLPGGWTVGSAPTISYDWTNDQAEVPLNLSITKTVLMGGRPWKLGLEANYYIENDDKRPDFMIGFNVTPVVKNHLADLF